MQGLDKVTPTNELLAIVAQLVERLGEMHCVASPRWADFATRIGLGHTQPTPGELGATVVVGSPADVLRHARTTQQREFGFVAPIARRRVSGLRRSNWREDLTLLLWEHRWTPVAIDRHQIAGEGETIEFVVGNARPTPSIADT